MAWVRDSSGGDAIWLLGNRSRERGLSIPRLASRLRLGFRERRFKCRGRLLDNFAEPSLCSGLGTSSTYFGPSLALGVPKKAPGVSGTLLALGGWGPSTCPQSDAGQRVMTSAVPLWRPRALEDDVRIVGIAPGRESEHATWSRSFGGATARVAGVTHGEGPNGRGGNARADFS